MRYWSDKDLDDLVRIDFGEYYSKWKRLLAVEKADWVGVANEFYHKILKIVSRISNPCIVAID